MAVAFSFDLVSPERLLASQQAVSVVIPATEGEMTVMASHAPVMSTIRPGVVTVTDEGGAESRFVVFGGFADILPDSCTLLAESAVRVEDIDKGSLDQRIADAQEDVNDAKDEESRARAEEYLHQLKTLADAVS